VYSRCSAPWSNLSFTVTKYPQRKELNSTQSDPMDFVFEIQVRTKGQVS
jgi:hypothetical protein